MNRNLLGGEFDERKKVALRISDICFRNARARAAKAPEDLATAMFAI
jgi:hypothetical protein